MFSIYYTNITILHTVKYIKMKSNRFDKADLYIKKNNV